jgi:hypothetical protein
MSRAHVAAAHAAGDPAELLEIDGDHFTVIDSAAPVWDDVLAWISRRH